MAALLLAGMGLAEQVPLRSWWPALIWPDPASMAQVVAADSTLPRLAASLTAGAALGLAGALLQQVLRNPLAAPETLGISAGSHLALAAMSLYAPGVLAAVGRDAVAFGGGALAVAAVLALSWHGRLAPTAVLLSGLAVSLYAGALGTVLVLLHTRQLAGLFVWGSGSLVQLGWAVPGHLLAVLAAAGLATGVLARPLRLLDLPDDMARGLGLPVPLVRLAGLAAAVALGGSVVSMVGVIGFVGLGAPTLVRLAGCGGRSLALSPFMGAALLAVTDQVVQRASGLGSALLPTGAVTALLGAPLLLWLLTRVSIGGAGAPDLNAAGRSRRAAPLLVALAAGLVAAAAGAALVGNSLHGWAVDAAMLPFRLPRVAAAATGGAMLAVAGLILQRMLRNPIASPDVLGLTTGTMIGLLCALWFGASDTASRLLAGGVGAACVLALLLAYARGGARPERMLLAGLAAGAAFDALLAVLLASGDPLAEAVLTSMSGSTYAVGSTLAWVAAVLLAVLLGLAALVARWLELLPLGEGVARSLGLRTGWARGALLLLVGALTGVATLLVGPLSFVGLMAPHIAALLGLTRALPQAAGAALSGAAIMVVADWAGRTLLFPTEIPAGLVAALLGGPVLLWVLAHRP